MVKKIYRSKNYLSLNVVVYIDDKQEVKVSCSFTGGASTPVRITGSYRTTDPKIQKALERHPWFNIEYFLQNTIAKDPVPVPSPEKEAPRGNEKIVSEAVSAQQAREELNKKYGVSFSKMRNSEAVLAKAAELGIVYPKWVR